MPVYQFKSSDGELIEEYFPSTSPQAIGASIRRRGKLFRRIISSVYTPKEFKPYVSYALPKRAPGFAHDGNGRPIVESRAQERAYAKANGLEFVTSKE